MIPYNNDKDPNIVRSNEAIAAREAANRQGAIDRDNAIARNKVAQAMMQAHSPGDGSTSTATYYEITGNLPPMPTRGTHGGAEAPVQSSANAYSLSSRR